MLRSALLLCLAIAATPLPALCADQPLFSAEGYRIDRYRSPTPATVEGAQTLDTPALQQLLRQGEAVLLIDTLRNTWLHGRFVGAEHRNIPGSLWLANVGDGELVSPWKEYFEHHLQQATGRNLQRKLVFYCKSDCWLSWNAARRALTLGYTHVYWYRDGVDAWQEAGLPLETAKPAALP